MTELVYYPESVELVWFQNESSKGGGIILVLIKNISVLEGVFIKNC